MSKPKNVNLHIKNAIRGNRLTEAMKRKGIGNAELIRQAKARSKTYFNMSSQRLSMIKSGNRPLDPDEAAVFAEILGEDAAWLMGEPGAHLRSLVEHERQAEKYRILLNMIGANIISYISDEDEDGSAYVESYGVSYNQRPYDPDETAAILNKLESDGNEKLPAGLAAGSNFDVMTVSVADMDSFYNDVCRFIEKRFEILRALSSEEV